MDHGRDGYSAIQLCQIGLISVIRVIMLTLYVIMLTLLLPRRLPIGRMIPLLRSLLTHSKEMSLKAIAIQPDISLQA